MKIFEILKIFARFATSMSRRFQRYPICHMFYSKNSHDSLLISVSKHCGEGGKYVECCQCVIPGAQTDVSCAEEMFCLRIKEEKNSL